MLACHAGGPGSIPGQCIIILLSSGLKIVVVCFEKQLTSQWHRITQGVQDFGAQFMGEMMGR